MQGVLPFALNNAGQMAGTLDCTSSAGALNLFVNTSAVLYTRCPDGETTILLRHRTGAAGVRNQFERHGRWRGLWLEGGAT